MIYGYCRVSTKKQNLTRQKENILKAYPDAKIYTEAFTGTTTQRPEWNKLKARLQDGDAVIFDEVSRMSRNAEEGIELYKELFYQGITLVFLKEPQINTDTYKSTLKQAIKVDTVGTDAPTSELINAITKAVNDYLITLAECQIKIAFDKAEAEVIFLHQRVKEGMKASPNKAGRREGTKIITQKEKDAKKQILKYSKTFNGTMPDAELLRLCNITHNTLAKYKRELKQLNDENGII